MELWGPQFEEAEGKFTEWMRSKQAEQARIYAAAAEKKRIERETLNAISSKLLKDEPLTPELAEYVNQNRSQVERDLISRSNNLFNDKRSQVNTTPEQRVKIAQDYSKYIQLAYSISQDEKAKEGYKDLLQRSLPTLYTELLKGQNKNSPNYYKYALNDQPGTYDRGTQYSIDSIIDQIVANNYQPVTLKERQLIATNGNDIWDTTATYYLDSSGNLQRTAPNTYHEDIGRGSGGWGGLLGGIANLATGGAYGAVTGDYGIMKDIMPFVNPGVVSAKGVYDGLINGDYASALQYAVDPVTEPGIDTLARGSGEVIYDAVPEIKPYVKPVVTTVAGAIAPWAAVPAYALTSKMEGSEAKDAVIGGATIGATIGAGSLLSNLSSVGTPVAGELGGGLTDPAMYQAAVEGGMAPEMGLMDSAIMNVKNVGNSIGEFVSDVKSGIGDTWTGIKDTVGGLLDPESLSQVEGYKPLVYGSGEMLDAGSQLGLNQADTLSLYDLSLGGTSAQAGTPLQYGSDSFLQAGNDLGLTNQQTLDLRDLSLGGSPSGPMVYGSDEMIKAGADLGMTPEQTTSLTDTSLGGSSAWGDYLTDPQFAKDLAGKLGVQLLKNAGGLLGPAAAKVTSGIYKPAKYKFQNYSYNPEGLGSYLMSVATNDPKNSSDPQVAQQAWNKKRDEEEEQKSTYWGDYFKKDYLKGRLTSLRDYIS
jgi:hypothetical protein